MSTDQHYTPPVYPFGFGFALMQNPQAIAHFSQMNENEQRELSRRLRSVASDEEWKGIVLGLSMRSPTI